MLDPPEKMVALRIPSRQKELKWGGKKRKNNKKLTL